MKKFLNLFLIVIFVMDFAALSIAETLNEVAEKDADYNHIMRNDDLFEADHEESDHSLGGTMMARFLAQKKQNRPNMTCDKYPRICHSKASPGPHCCKKKCVDVRRDRLNCGMCGKKCKYNESCCNGKCINPSFNKRHCGGCNNKCGSGSSCVLGLCNYSN